MIGDCNDKINGKYKKFRYGIELCGHLLYCPLFLLDRIMNQQTKSKSVSYYV